MVRARQLLAATALAAAALSHAVSPAAAQRFSTKWAYYGSNGPAFWGSINPQWKTCDSGRQQSPIDIKPTAGVERLTLSSVATQFTASFLPKAVQNGFKYNCVSTEGCGTAVWKGTNYKLVQFHLHVAAEHTLNGAIVPGEIHLVHASDAGNLLVVGTLIDVGAPSPLLAKMLEGVEKAVTGSNPKKFSRLPISKKEWSTMVFGGRGFCHYRGSLTTPPCSEGVNWIVSRRVISASVQQLARLARALLNSEAVVLTERPTQPINGRNLVCYGA